MPKAIRIHRTGGPEVMVWQDVEVGDPGPGEVRLRQTAVGLNFLDIYHNKVIHGPTFAKHYVLEGFDFQLGPGGRYHAEYQTNTMAPDGVSLFGPMPWTKDKAEDFAFLLFLRPNFNFFGRFDLVQPLVSYTSEPMKSPS